MAFEIKPEDFGIGVEPEIEQPKPNTQKTYMKNALEMAKDIKKIKNEFTDFFGISPKEAGKMLKDKILGTKPNQFNHKTPNKPIIADYTEKPFKRVEPKTPEQPQITTNNQEKMDFDKKLKQIKLVVKLLKAENMKVTEFIKLIEDEKEDIKEIFE